MDNGAGDGVSSCGFPSMEGSPDWLSTSDGNPNTITVPAALPNQNGDGDPDRIAAAGKELIRY